MKRRVVIFIALLFFWGANTVYGVDETLQPSGNQGSPEKKTESVGTAAELSRKDFEQVILPSIQGVCRCHQKNFNEYEKVLSLVSVKDPVKSKFYQKAKGEDGHPEVWPAGSTELKALERWILGEPLTEKPSVVSQ